MQNEERETVIQIGYAENRVSIWSTQKAVWARCKRAGWTLSDESKDRSGSIVGQEWTAPLDCLTFTPKSPTRKRRTGQTPAGLTLARKRKELQHD